MDDTLFRTEFLEGSECFQFEKVWVGEHFEVAAEIGIARSSNERSAFYEQITVPVIGAPASRVIDAAHLFFEATGWFGELFQLNVFAAKNPARVSQIGERPHGENAHRLVMILIHGGLRRERKNGLSTRTQHGRRPGGKLNRSAIVISETVGDADLRATRS